MIPWSLIIGKPGPLVNLTDWVGLPINLTYWLTKLIGNLRFLSFRSGVCALQADVKLPGISLAVIQEAVEGGMEANHQILDIMAACISAPREAKDCWPVTRRLQVGKEGED